ncbi:MAG: RIO1 family regulatory kinase/ATPase [Halobacteriales archaeon]|nr:RIO1 family regulatory kinase/ATPase [Halobacteriales archaeon]
MRRLLRGTIEWDRLEQVARELAARYDEPTVRVEFLEADNWLSTPFVVNDEWFVKVITKQNALVQALFTGARNLGALSSGNPEGFFESFDGPVEMAEHELEATERMREIGVNAPEPIEAFEIDGLGILVLEYLPTFRVLDELPAEDVEPYATTLFESLATIHDDGLVHGDLRQENVLIRDGKLYFIDATKVSGEGVEAARAYDLACALGVLTPIIGAAGAVQAALTVYSIEDLLEAEEFLDFVNIRPDHDFDAAAIKGEIDKHATG